MSKEKSTTNKSTVVQNKSTVVQKREFPDKSEGYDLNWIFRVSPAKNNEIFFCCYGLRDLVVDDGAAIIVNHNGMVWRRQNSPTTQNDRLKACPVCDTPIIHEDLEVLSNGDIKKFKEEAKIENNKLNA